MKSPILAPVVALLLWTLVMMLSMDFTRLSVGPRVIHRLVQATANIIRLRFIAFAMARCYC